MSSLPFYPLVVLASEVKLSNTKTVPVFAITSVAACRRLRCWRQAAVQAQTNTQRRTESNRTCTCATARTRRINILCFLSFSILLYASSSASTATTVSWRSNNCRLLGRKLSEYCWRPLTKWNLLLLFLCSMEMTIQEHRSNCFLLSLNKSGWLDCSCTRLLLVPTTRAIICWTALWRNSLLLRNYHNNHSFRLKNSMVDSYRYVNCKLHAFCWRLITGLWCCNEW